REEEEAVEADADAPGTDLAQLHVEEGDQAAGRREAVVHAVHRSVRGAGRVRGPDPARDDTVPDLLALEVSPRRGRRHRLADTAGVDLRVAARLDDRERDRGAEEEDPHDREDGVALPPVLDHSTEGECE